jgi:hypothetical protein
MSVVKRRERKQTVMTTQNTHTFQLLHRKAFTSSTYGEGKQIRQKNRTNDLSHS